MNYPAAELRGIENDTHPLGPPLSYMKEGEIQPGNMCIPLSIG